MKNCVEQLSRLVPEETSAVADTKPRTTREIPVIIPVECVINGEPYLNLGEASRYIEAREAEDDTIWEERRMASAAKDDPPYNYYPIETGRKPFEEEKTFEDFTSSIPFPSNRQKRKKKAWEQIQNIIRIVKELDPALDQECRIALLIYYVFVNVKVPLAKGTELVITSKREIAELLGFTKEAATEGEARSGLRKMQRYLDLIDNSPRLDGFYNEITRQLSPIKKSIKPSPNSRSKNASAAA